MTVETSRKILKVIGILSIIFGILTILGGVLLVSGGSLAQQSGEVSFSAEQLQVLKIGSTVTIVLGLISFLQGIFSVRAAKDFNKIMPAWVFAVINFAVSILDAVYGIIRSTEARTIATAAVSVALAILVLGAANKIKKHVGK